MKLRTPKKKGLTINYSRSIKIVIVVHLCDINSSFK